MTVFAPALLRAQRLVRLFHEVHEQTGSVRSALRYTGRLVVAKAPLLLRHARQTARHKHVVHEIGAVRDGLNTAVPLIAIRVTGGIGDHLVIARFMRDLRHYVGRFVFDVYSNDPRQADWIFAAVDGFRACYHDLLFEFTLTEYDLSARISQFVILHERLARWSRIRQNPRLVEVATNILRFRPKIEPFIEHHPYLDNFLAQKALYANCNRSNFLHYMAGLVYGGDQLGIVTKAEPAAKYGLVEGHYVTVHNGFDPGFVITNQQATKCYPHFGAVVAWLKHRWPGLSFVQIGTSTSRPIAEVDTNLLGRTSLAEVTSLIKGARLHIDNEGGLVHLARCLGVDSCVVFGPTPSSYFGYDGNINIDPAFCGGCWWINETWMNQCPRGFASARCLTEQDPISVATAIHHYLLAQARVVTDSVGESTSEYSSAAE